ncbi:MAG: hypothetical protein KBT11_08965 [Treponema sp.]|nr:hypothetical protein [Candidatus Treponema equifaecale]
MDDNEYYAMMRRQYSNPIAIKKIKTKPVEEKTEPTTSGTFTQWSQKYGHEDAEMFMERNQENSAE